MNLNFFFAISLFEGGSRKSPLFIFEKRARKRRVKQGLGRPTSDNNHSVHALRCEERKHPFVLSELTLFQCPNSASSVKARMHKRNILFVSVYLLIFVVYEHADYIFRIAYRLHQETSGHKRSASHGSSLES